MPTLAADFIFRFTSDPPDCNVVAIHRTQHYLLLCRPGLDSAEWSPIHSLSIPIEEDQPHHQRIYDACLCKGKLYAITGTCMTVIEGIETTQPGPKVRHFRLGKYFALCGMFQLVESRGRLYVACKSKSIRRRDVLRVGRWQLFSNRFVKANDIGNNLFMLGPHYSVSLPVSSSVFTARAGGMIYFFEKYYGFCCFNIRCRSLTTHYSGREHHRKHQALVLIDEQLHNLDEQHIGGVEQTMLTLQETKKITDQDRMITRTMPRRTLNRMFGRRGADVISWTPTTPWLMFASSMQNAKFKFLDPCSNRVYEIHLPELQGRYLCHASDGWLVVIGRGLKFFFNPFTGRKIYILRYERMLVCHQFALSASPTSEDCLIFSIRPVSEDSGSIYLFRMSSRESIEIYYKGHPSVGLPLSNPVYFKGIFYCVGSNGNLGTYDPATNKWSVKDMHLGVLLHPSIQVGNCFLIRSGEELMSVFVDRNENLVGVYRLDFVYYRWREVGNIGDRTLFVGLRGSFIASSGIEEMHNKIYSSKFVQDEHGGATSTSELLCHQVGGNSNSNSNGGSPFTRTDRFMSLWIEPQGVKFGYDRATGKMVPPVRFSHSLPISMTKKRKKSHSKLPNPVLKKKKRALCVLQFAAVASWT